MERVAFTPPGMPSRDGRGLFAVGVDARYPACRSRKKGDSTIRICAKLCRAGVRLSPAAVFSSPRWTLGGLVRFHTAHKLVLMAHSPKAYSELGRFVANAKRMARDKVREHTRRACSWKR